MIKMEEFFKKAESDEAIKAELKAIFEGKKSEELTAEVIAKITELAKNHGFEADEPIELSDDELDKVAGGVITPIYEESEDYGLSILGYEVNVFGKKVVCDTLEEAKKLNSDMMIKSYMEEFDKNVGMRFNY